MTIKAKLGGAVAVTALAGALLVPGIAPADPASSNGQGKGVGNPGKVCSGSTDKCIPAKSKGNHYGHFK